MTQKTYKKKKVRFTLPNHHKPHRKTKKGKKNHTNFLVRKHPFGWHPKHHYMCIGGQCGQSCPCCRAELGDKLGTCPYCKIQKAHKSLIIPKS